jgi:hypothetical protein
VEAHDEVWHMHGDHKKAKHAKHNIEILIYILPQTQMARIGPREIRNSARKVPLGMVMA